MFLAIIVLGFMSYKTTLALFSDTAQSTNNTFTASEVFPTPTPIPVNAGDVVINEINWVGSTAPGGGNDECVELLNTTSNPININGWVIENLGTGSGPGANITIATTSATIPGNGFYLISAKNKEDSRINVDPDLTVGSISLNNDGEQLILKTSATGTIIDTANGTGSWFEGVTSNPKKSMERKSPPGDGTQAANWQDATTHTNMDGSTSSDEFGTPKAANEL